MSFNKIKFDQTGTEPKVLVNNYITILFLKYKNGLRHFNMYFF